MSLFSLQCCLLRKFSSHPLDELVKSEAIKLFRDIHPEAEKELRCIHSRFSPGFEKRVALLISTSPQAVHNDTVQILLNGAPILCINLIKHGSPAPPVPYW